MKTPAQIKQIAKRVAHGAVGYVDATLGRGLAPEPVIELRQKICDLCDQNSPCLFNAETRCCGPMLAVLQGGPECGCRLDKKTRLAREFCPNGHWDAMPAETDSTASDSGSSNTDH
jgi:hypothetical protein